jgi:outer membrane protein OmpA-like peptidoglycan-associated protein
MKRQSCRHAVHMILLLNLLVAFAAVVPASAADRQAQREKETQQLQERFQWWPTDAKPAPVKDEVRGGYWWWPTQPGSTGSESLWGNRGYIYVYKVIFDYRSDELPAPKAGEERAALIIKKIIRNVKVYFDFNAAEIRPDAQKVLAQAVGTLKRNPEADILITGNCDTRGSETYNQKLGQRRAETVRQFMLDNKIDPERVRIVSRGKLDAVSPVSDLVGMQKDRNAQFMIAEVEEVMVPYAGDEKNLIDQAGEDKTLVVQEELTGEIKVDTKEYVVQKGDTLWKIAAGQLGSGHRWKYIYELNKEKIKNPDKLRVGTRLEIPVE